MNSDSEADPAKVPSFNACDADREASELIRRGDLEGARQALLVRNYLREMGDTSTEPTPHSPPTAESYEEAALALEAQAARDIEKAERLIELADKARELATEKRKEEERGGTA